MRGLPTRPLRAAAIALGLAGLLTAAAWAHHWKLETATLPAPFLRDGRVDVVIEPSGVALLGDGRRVLMAHDEAASLYVKVRAFAADITAAPSPEASLELRPMFTFDAGACERVAAQLASLEYVPAMSGFLVLTATEDADNAFHGNTLWLVADGQTRRARQYATFEVAMKAGGMAVLGVKASGHLTTIKVLITFDNDAHATKIPSRFQTATLTHDRS